MPRLCERRRGEARGAAKRSAERRRAAAELVVIEEQAAQPRRRARGECRSERARARVAELVVGDRELLEFRQPGVFASARNERLWRSLAAAAQLLRARRVTQSAPAWRC